MFQQLTHGGVPLFSSYAKSKSKSYSRRSAGVLLLVGVLAGVTVGGGVGVIAASSTKSVTVCADKKTNVLRYAENGKCAKTESKVVLNQAGVDGTAGMAGAKGDTGAAGVKGAAGADGAAGAKGDTGAAGAKGAAGADGAAGAKGAAGVDGAAGAKGDTGAAGAKGDTGAAGAKGDTGAAGASSPTGFTERSVCGSNGTTLCAVGEQGPGGGTIVYVDSTNEMPMYDYLEVAPADASAGVAWSTSTAKCGTDATTSCQSSYLSDAGSSLGYIGLGTGRAATAAIVARHDAGGVPKTTYAAGIADNYTTATASDWFLPSKDELNEVCKYARNTSQLAGADTVCTGGSAPTLRGFALGGYWSSSELGASGAWLQFFNNGSQDDGGKASTYYVRPVRAF